jgi:radical SAM superfamily enzyme YgiQ (UPF0313 family)
MNVLFIQNLGINESLALTDLSAFLESKGNRCELLIDKEEKDLFVSISRFSPGIFIIPWDIGMFSWVLDLSRRIKNKYDKPIVFCGTYPSFYPDVAIGCAETEVICLGESEYAIAEFIERLERKEDIRNIKNLWVKADGLIYKNPLRELVKDLNSLPMPDRDIYFKYGYLRGLSMKRFASGRGCLNSCSFCYNRVFRDKYRGKGEYVRRKSVSRMIEEIRDVGRISILKSVHFSDDIFTHDKKWILEFGRAYKEEIGLPFTCNATADTIDEELADSLKKAGCAGIAMGIETGNEKLRSLLLNKNISNKQILNAARLIKERGIYLATFNMIALPTETLEDAFETIRLNARMRTDHTRLNFALPLPETKLTEIGVEGGFFTKEEIRQITDTTLYPGKPVFKDRRAWLKENLFHLFNLGVRFPSLLPIIRLMVRVPLLKFIFMPFNMAINSYREKAFFNITWHSGMRYFIHSGNLRERTKVFNNYLP